MVVLLGMAAWLLGSLTDLHDRFSRQSRELGIAFLIVLILFLLLATFWLGRSLWHSRTKASGPVQAPADVIQAATVQANEAEGVIRQVEDQSARADLNQELAALRGQSARSRVPRRRLRHGLRR
jgi:hypothetical protein